MPAIPESAITFTTLLVGLLTTGVLVLLPSTWRGDGRAVRYWVIGNLALSLDRLYTLVTGVSDIGPVTLLTLPLAGGCVLLGAGMHVAAMRLLLQPERPVADWRWPAAAAAAMVAVGWNLQDAVLDRLALVLGTGICIVLLLRICWPQRRQLRGAWVMAITMGFFLLMSMAGAVALGQLATRGPAAAAPPQPLPILALDMVLSVVVNLAFLLILIEQLHQRVERLSVTDPLTGVLNRRGFLQAANLQLLHADRMHFKHRAASVLLLDLDHFKRINDSLGHPMGDAVLRGAAERVLAVVRQTDVVARWGGEEFVLLLPGTPLTPAREVAERVRQAIGATPLAPGAPVVTVSIGAAALVDVLAVDQLPQLIAEADRRLYLAKRQRNCVVAEDDGAAAAALSPAAPPARLAGLAGLPDLAPPAPPSSEVLPA